MIFPILMRKTMEGKKGPSDIGPLFSENWMQSPSYTKCMKVKSESEVAQLCPTASDPVDCSLPNSPVHGIFQAGVLEWGAVAFSAPC